MTGYRPPRFSGLGAHVSGMSAWVLVSVLERAKALDSIQRLPPEARGEVLRTYDALRASAIYWDENVREAAPASTSPVVPAAPSVQAQAQITAIEAAAILGCSDRRVRQLLAAQALTGQRVAGRWLVDATSVADYSLAKDVA